VILQISHAAPVTEKSAFHNKNMVALGVISVFFLALKLTIFAFSPHGN